jgi:pimeloyl-ACP methyl ester carboxylesterase
MRIHCVRPRSVFTSDIGRRLDARSRSDGGASSAERIIVMATLKRPEGVEIHWEATGHGPLVVLAPNSVSHPSVYEPLIAELAGDHRVVWYDARGTGESTRQGPYDMDTDAADLAALIDATSGPAVLFGLVEANNVCLRTAAAHPQLVRAVIGPKW